jgi:hypothetical protein
MEEINLHNNKKRSFSDTMQNNIGMDYTIDFETYASKDPADLMRDVNYKYKRCNAIRFLYHNDASYFKKFNVLLKLTILVVAATVTLVTGLTSAVTGESSTATRIVTIVGGLFVAISAAVNIAYDPIINQKTNEEAGDRYGKVANRIIQTILISRDDKVQLYKLVSYITRKINKYDGKYDHQNEEAIDERMKHIGDLV